MTNPTDGRITSLQVFTGTLATSALLSVVSPGNATSGVNYGLPFANLATNVASAILPNAATGTWLAGQGASTAPSFVPVSGDVLVTNNTTIATTTIATHAVTFAKFQQVTGLSVVGVAGTATADLAAITGTTDQVLRVAANGTTLGFGAINLATSAAVTGVLPVPNGGTNTSTLTQAGVLFGNGTSTIGITAAGATALPLTATGGTAAPTFSVLTVPGGGTGTTTLTVNRVLIGNGATTLALSNVATTGFALVGNGTSAAPGFAVLGVPGGGLGIATTTPFAVLTGGTTATSQVQSLATTGTSGFVLASQGAAALPIWVAAGAGTVTNVTGAGVATGAVTTSGSITVTAATQNDMTTATATTLVVTPGRQQFHPSAAKAWVGFTGSNGSTVSAYNVSSVTRNSTGSYNINFTVAFATATAYIAAIGAASAGAGFSLGFSDSSVNSAGLCRINYQNSVGSPADPGNGWVVFYGTQ